MSFAQSSIYEVRATRDGSEIFVAWTSSAPSGTWFQVYVDRRLSWTGSSRSCVVPTPGDAVGRNAWIEVGSVDPSEAQSDFSTSLVGPSGLGNRVVLNWLGGSYLDQRLQDDVRGFWIYRSLVAGGSVDFSNPIATVTAYPGSTINDGYGVGGFGQGSYGKAATSYQWYGGPMAPGLWTYTVVPFDAAGNTQGSPSTVTLSIASPPRAPAADALGCRLKYTYAGPGTRVVTLQWLASSTSGG